MNYFMRKWHKFVNEQKDSNRVSKVVLFSGNKILFLISKNGPFAEQLDLPGGHIRHGEDSITGLYRETKEETGLNIRNVNELLQIDNVTFYWGTLPGEPITLSDEHSAYHISNFGEIIKKGYTISDKLSEAINLAYEEVNK